MVFAGLSVHPKERVARLHKIRCRPIGKDHANTLPGAEAVAEHILNTELPRLYLAPVDWWVYPVGKESAELERYNDLVGGYLQYGFMAQATSLTKDLDQITQQPLIEYRPARSGVGGLVPNPAHQFVLALGNLLNVHQAPFMESARGVFEYLLRNYALAPFPVYPTRSDRWAHRPRGCGRNCALCAELDELLVSPVRQTAEFAAAAHSRTHFSWRLMEGPLHMHDGPKARPQGHHGRHQALTGWRAPRRRRDGIRGKDKSSAALHRGLSA